MNVEPFCIHMERYYLGHGSPPTPPTPPQPLVPSTINSYLNECKILLHPHGTLISWPWFPAHSSEQPNLVSESAVLVSESAVLVSESALLVSESALLVSES